MKLTLQTKTNVHAKHHPSADKNAGKSYYEYSHNGVVLFAADFVTLLAVYLVNLKILGLSDATGKPLPIGKSTIGDAVKNVTRFAAYVIADHTGETKPLRKFTTESFNTAIAATSEFADYPTRELPSRKTKPGKQTKPATTSSTSSVPTPDTEIVVIPTDTSVSS